MARLNGVPSHETLERAVTALENLEHRGAAGADPLTGDGAGILLQLPDEFFRAVIARGAAAAGRLRRRRRFLPRGTTERARPSSSRSSSSAVEARGPARSSAGATSRWSSSTSATTAREVAPVVRQLVVAASHELADDRDAFERKLYVIRRVAEIARRRPTS